MSLALLTRNAYHSGISPPQWLALCKLWAEKERLIQESIGAAITDAVLSLCSIHEPDAVLAGYLKHALSDGLLSTSTFTSTFLRAACSSELHNAPTLDMLCRIALDAHYSSGVPPLGSLIPLATPQNDVMATVHDALRFLHHSYTLPSSNFHCLSTSASELATLLLSCVTDVSQVSTTQGMICLGDASDLLHSVRLSSELRQALEPLALSLSLLIGDDAKATREAQVMHMMQLALGKNDTSGSNAESDTITCSLLLQSLISSRAGDYGAGSDIEAVALLMWTLKWTSWTPNVFYTQILVAMMTCVGQSTAKGTHDASFFMWKSFVIGRLPRLLRMFGKALEGHSTTEAECHAAMHAAVSSVLQRSDLLTQCDSIQAQSRGQENESYGSFLRQLMHEFIAFGLIDQAFATTMDPPLMNSTVNNSLQAEAFEHNCTLENYLESKLTIESSQDDAQLLLNRIRHEPASHHFFAEVIRKSFVSRNGAPDLEVLSHLTKILYAHDFALDILSLHLKITNLAFEALEIVHEYDCETVGDPQTAVSHLGDIVLFIQMLLTKFKISAATLKRGTKSLDTTFLRSSRVYFPEDFPTDIRIVFAGWFKALFDSSSEGIDDNILRSTKPKALLQMSPTLFSQACIARQEGRIDNDVLHNGISYFLGRLLNWTLVGVVHAMLFEVQQRGLAAPFQLEVLQSLLLAPTCPHIVLRLCSPNILKILAGKRTQVVVSSLHYDIGAIRSAAFRTLAMKKDGSAQAQEEPSTTPPGAFLDFPRREIREAFILARERKAPRIDVARCLTITTPTKFLLLLWSELGIAASLGEMEACRRLATFVLVTPRSGVPPLLPLFVYNVLPVLTVAIDQQGGDTDVNTELLTLVISTALSAAFHLEWALQAVCNDEKYVLGQPSATIARKLAADLRTRKVGSSTSTALLHRLCSSPPFVSNFPVFMQ
ncbi:mediator complex subunit Med5-domain-containing protein [Phlebopus sp. FC_14]|nr:mediator complex subunit Med5-domain-containing protein [Phlebopus sp. FC_14]